MTRIEFLDKFLPLMIKWLTENLPEEDRWGAYIYKVFASLNRMLKCVKEDVDG